jgi:hypothetical protein
VAELRRQAVVTFSLHVCAYLLRRRRVIEAKGIDGIGKSADLLTFGSYHILQTSSQEANLEGSRGRLCRVHISAVQGLGLLFLDRMTWKVARYAANGLTDRLEKGHKDIEFRHFHWLRYLAM